MLHRMDKMKTVDTDVHVCLSVCHSHVTSVCINGWMAWGPVWDKDAWGPKNIVLDDPLISGGENAFDAAFSNLLWRLDILRLRTMRPLQASSSVVWSRIDMILQ